MDPERTFALFYAATAISTLLACKRAFFNDRILLPRRNLFSTASTLQLPLAISRLMWHLDLALLLLVFTIALFSHIPSYLLLLHAIWCVLILCLDRLLWSPHLIHFGIAALALALRDFDSLKVFAVLLYFYGGIQKLNKTFYREMIPDFFGPILRRWMRLDLTYLNAPKWVQPLSALIAISEAALGLSLAIPSLQVIGSIFLVMMHLGILILLGPLGANQFQGVWGWNVLCIAQLFFLFIYPPTPFPTSSPNIFPSIYFNSTTPLLSDLFSPLASISSQLLSLFSMDLSLSSSSSSSPLLMSPITSTLSNLISTPFNPLLWTVLVLAGLLPLLNILFHFAERSSFKMHSNNEQYFLFYIPDPTYREDDDSNSDLDDQPCTS